MKIKSLILIVLLAIGYSCSDDPEDPAPVLSTETDILSFSITGATGAATINSANFTIDIEMAFGTDLTDLSPTFALSAGATSIPTSGTSADYSSAVTISVTAEDGATKQDWTVNVTKAGPGLSSGTDILTFSFPEQTAAATIDSPNYTIAIEVANTADLTTLTPEFTLSASATSAPASGTVGDYSSAFTITVTAEDGTTTQDWIVTVTKAAAGPSSSADVLAFSIPQQTALGSVDATTNSITIEVSNGANLASLTPTITISPGATSDPVSETVGDYTSAVTIKVTAEDGTTIEDWTVTVTEAAAPGGPASDETDVLTITVPGQEQEAYIDPRNHIIMIVTASGTDLTNITPTFTLSPFATSQPLSGTAGNYQNAGDIVVTAQDGTTQQLWIVKMTNGFDAAGICDINDCANDEALSTECETFFAGCIGTFGEDYFVQCAFASTTKCD